VLTYVLYTFFLHLVLPTITYPTEDTSSTIFEGNSITFTCEALGYPPPIIVWSKTNDGVLSDRISVSNVSAPNGYGNVTNISSTLTITSADVDDRGVYECTAVNRVSSTSIFFTLDVDGMLTTAATYCTFILIDYFKVCSFHGLMICSSIFEDENSLCILK